MYVFCIFIKSTFMKLHRWLILGKRMKEHLPRNENWPGYVDTFSPKQNAGFVVLTMSEYGRWKRRFICFQHRRIHCADEGMKEAKAGKALAGKSHIEMTVSFTWRGGLFVLAKNDPPPLKKSTNLFVILKETLSWNWEAEPLSGNLKVGVQKDHARTSFGL